MKKQFKLTQDGINELIAELDKLVAERSHITERIKNARELGDLSENAEYASARSEQERNENRIKEVEHILKNVEKINSPKNNDKVKMGSSVKLKGRGGKTLEFKVVGTVEADPLVGKISDESPIGQVLLGRKVGEEVEIATPVEIAKYVIAELG
jgi:transcription elongation factor GreA